MDCCATKLELLSVPDHPLLNVLSYLSYKDLISCQLTCSRLHNLTQHDPLWRRQCKFHWNVTKVDPDDSWQKIFQEWYKDFGKYMNVYKSVRKAWDQIENYTREYLPEIYQQLEDGVKESQLDEIERSIKIQLPLAMRCSYRIHNGQKFKGGPGLMGSMCFSAHYRTESLFSIQMATDNLQDGSLKHCIPLTFCLRSDVSQLMALTDEGGYLAEQIFYACPDNTTNGFVMDNFITADSFMKWLTLYAQTLADNLFPIMVLNKQSHIYRFYHEPTCIEVSHHIQVAVSTCFIPELSTIHPAHFFHTYHIKMSMAEDAPRSASCKLESRYWVVTDEEGNEEIVQGSGVVGEHPLMEPGSSFSWTSCITFSTTYGNMHGHFTMQNQLSGATVDVQCPVFHLKCLPYQTSEERDQRMAKKKKVPTATLR